jgi:hypothetical protein
MAQAPGMDVLERYGGFQKGNARTNKGGGGKGYAPGGGSRERYTMPPLAENSEGLPPEMEAGMDFPPQPYDYTDTKEPPYDYNNPKNPMSSVGLSGDDALYQQRFQTLKQGLYGPEYVQIMQQNGYPDDKGETLGDFADSNWGQTAAELLKGGSQEDVMQAKAMFTHWLKDYTAQGVIEDQKADKYPTSNMPTQPGGGFMDIPR